MIVINNFMIEDLKLSGNELILYAEIASNLNSTGQFQKTYKTMVKETGMTKISVERTLKKLTEKKLINIKRVKDGKPYVINIITLKNKQLGMITDKQFKDIIGFWNGTVNYVEDLNNKNYNAYLSIIQLPGFCLDDFKYAIQCYSDTIHDREYYKSHIYKFEKFVKIWQDYTENGCERLAYNAFKRKQNRFTVCDRPFDEQEMDLITDEELGSVEM